MTHVVPFAAASAPASAAASAVSSWATTDDEVTAWCSRTGAPVPPDVIVEWGTAPDVHAYLLIDAEDPVAYGELWVDDDEHEVELARIIVAPAHRGRGLGRRFVTELTTMAKRFHPSVIMRVRPGNDAAVACYTAAGFQRLDPSAELEWNEGQPVAYLWMVVTAER